MSTADNACGSCNACCRVYAIPEVDKPAGRWCQHCDIGKGCKIYATRPARCVDFQCLWLQSQAEGRPHLEPELRPDRCKVVFAPTTNPRIMAAIAMPGNADAWRRPNVAKLINRFLKAGIAISFGEPQALRQKLFKPDGTVRDVEMTEPDAEGMQYSKETDL
jgi:hypothetical protein